MSGSKEVKRATRRVALRRAERADGESSAAAVASAERTAPPKAAPDGPPAPKRREYTNIDEVWRDFKKTGDKELRNVLIEKYLPLVKYIAERLLAKLPQNIELDDLTSAGIFGLMDAIEGFDLTRGVKFETYCTTRIRGAILDELRSLDWVPRIVRNKANRVEGAWKSLEMELGRTPTDMEMAERLQMTLPQYEELLREASAITIVSLTEKAKEDQGSKTLRKIDLLENKKQPDPESELKTKEITEFITKGLSRKERLIMLLYYYEDLTMREIGATLNLSESRVCQLHSRIIFRLKTQLKKYQAELLS
ncbi:MAG TPA: FliA/WhiG family RNA polymerase sigma factor [Planctomycetota bacterium]|nr:FliA/WhiG family RNA polymerase sigma factor [Planctomycetota bacterium]